LRSQAKLGNEKEKNKVMAGNARPTLLPGVVEKGD